MPSLTAIHVEITEDAMVVDFDTSVSVLAEWRAVGIRASIDDFGTGYSSLEHLHRLPADLGSTTVAEGVDTPETL